MAIVGLGVDIVDVRRFTTALTRTPSINDRLFDGAEPSASAEGLAARFAAKEAAVKALGGGRLRWRDIQVNTAPDGRPSIAVVGRAADAAAALGVRSWHVSLTHDGGMAVAVVVAEA